MTEGGYLLVLRLFIGCGGTKINHMPVGLCPEDSRQTTEPAGRWGPDSSLLLWFSSWPNTLHSQAHTPSRMLLQTKQQNTTQ